MEIISTNNAPKAIGPYAQALKAGNYLFCSGQLGIDPQSGKLAGSDTISQTKQVLKNIKEILSAAGLEMKDIVKTTIFLVSMDDFKDVNMIYANAMGDHKPARSTVQVAGLPLGAKMEIEAVAAFR